MSGNSSVGTSGVYEAGDQRNLKNSEIQHGEPYKEGKENSHQTTDSSTLPSSMYMYELILVC